MSIKRPMTSTWITILASRWFEYSQPAIDIGDPQDVQDAQAVRGMGKGRKT
ncbi:uncharacterized protein ARMOST_14384 [Armillaria ostoyae]|uniref:Uncharacterized protein n=1 Tax=Armillaria ostoyae TaxID=47428 RepID=A0A284RQF2_ARMOS|nr:uncharacterized protein ARMOST_14384 [Armillaria ostoyae]